MADSNSLTAQDDLASAIEKHQAGELAEAAVLYEKILSLDAENAPAHHWFGVLNHQRGDDARAIELIGRALALCPSVPAYHANLAEAYRGVGQLNRAVGSCRLALKLWPDCPEALCNLGLSFQQMGRTEEAVAQFQRALELREDLAPVHNNLGIALREIGRFDEALEHFRRAVELEPGFAPALTNLGQMLLDRGQAVEALPHCREAARLQPDLSVVHYNLGSVLRALDRAVEARAAYLEALRLDPDLALAHAHLGLTLLREDQPGEALPWLNQACELDTENVDFLEWLGNLYAEWERPTEAIPYFERALALASADRPSLHLSLGAALIDEGRLAEADEQYRIALRLAPDSVPVHLHLGGLQEIRGEMRDAESSYRTALRAAPKAPMPHARLAVLLRERLTDEDLAALEEVLSGPQLGKRARGPLLFGLAHVLDARGDYARAAECLREANALSRERAKGWRADVPGASDPFIEGLVEAFGPEFFSRTVGFGSDTRRPVFVFGLPRSGTTLIEQILSSHSLVHGAGELHLTGRSFHSVPTIMGRHGPPLECVPHLEEADVSALADQHLGWLSALDGGRAERAVDKMPGNYTHLGFLATLFPRATFIHCRRDLRDVAVSCWMTDFRMIHWANHFDHIADQFRQYRRLMDHWRSVLPVPVHEVDYEETVADMETVARRLIAACGLDWEPGCLAFHRARRPVRTASTTQVRQPIYSHSVGRWKNYESELADLFARLPIDEGPQIGGTMGNRQVEDLAVAMA